jgi:FkbM family methyltransferase
VLRINPTPRLAEELTRSGLIDEVILVDGGARGGVSSEWAAFEGRLRVIAFEPDSAEAARLESEAPPGWTYIAAALGSHRETRKLHDTRFPAGSGLYRSVDLFDRVANRVNVEPIGTHDVALVPLDDLVVGNVDFAKLDVELAEFDVIQGGRRTLSSALAVEIEIHFPKRPPDAGCFAEVDSLMRELGFELFDLDVYRFARGTFPSNALYDARDAGGNPIPGPTVEGPVLTGDALYVRDLARSAAPTARQVSLLAAFYEIHRLPDCADELLRVHGESLGVDVENLLALLVPRADGVTAVDGRQHGPNYHLFEQAWRERRAP